jgi:hypothetical protein
MRSRETLYYSGSELSDSEELLTEILNLNVVEHKRGSSHVAIFLRQAVTPGP